MSYTNEQLVHIWANQVESEGKNSNGSIFFEGDIIYSYGHHFPMAKHGYNFTFITTNSYSNTTTKHMSLVRRSIRNKVFYVENVLAETEQEHVANFEAYAEEVKTLLKKASRARQHKASLLEQALNMSNAANEYATKFKLKVELINTNINLDNVRVELLKKAQAEKVKLKAYYEANRLKWISGEHVKNLYKMPIMLRLSSPIEILTSHGARFPLSDFVKLWPVVSRLVRGKSTYNQTTNTNNSFKLGYFKIDSIDENGTVKAGCHTVSWFEIVNFAECQGLI